MSSVGLSGLSNISNDTLQGRYEKALKQINKLIEINRELKERVGEYQAEVGGYEQQLQALQQANRELDEESNMLDAKYMELNSHYEQLEDYCKGLEEKLENHHLTSQEVDRRLKDTEAKYHEDLENEIDKYNALARESEFLQHRYQESLAAIEKLEEEERGLVGEVEALRRENEELKACNARLSETVTEKHVVQLEGQLEQASRSIEKLVRECGELKSRQIDFEVLEERQKVERYIGLSNDQQGDAVKQLIQQYKRKIKELEAEKREAEQKYKSLKAKASKGQNADNYLKKIESLERLTEKQQREIGRVIETYDRELNSIHKENVKIREAYVSLSQTLSKKGHELGERDKTISELKMTTDRVSFENESLRKVNSSLLEEKENKLKELSMLKDKIQHTESFTLGHLKSTSDNAEESGEKVKLKISQVQKGVYSVPPGLFEKEEPFITTSFKAKEETRNIPITVSYNSPSSEKGDFKFIQSVNIINGYNVSLGENTGRSSGQ